MKDIPFFRKMLYGIVKNGEFLTLRGIKYSERAYNLGEFVVWYSEEDTGSGL